jgi:hypothetical protein
MDCSDDPTTGNLDDLVMIAHAPAVHPGDKNYDLDGRLMDVRTGRFRRLPFPGGVVMPSCFLKDRRFVVVTGMDIDTGSLRPFEIDLKTRQCTALGHPVLDSGLTLFADVSPDGKTVVVNHIDAVAKTGLLNSQLFLIDLASGHAQPVGKPIDAAFVKWTADGRHLVMVLRKSKDLNSVPEKLLVTMDMEGHVTELLRGDEPTLLADRQTILFQDPDTDLLNTCDLEGKNVKLFANGLKGYGFASPGPDGKRILMMHFIPGALPQPVVLNIGESRGRVVTQVGGLWGYPVWR